LVPAPDGGDDFLRISDPGERPWVIIGLGEKAVDSGLKFDDRAEHSALEAASRQLGEESLYGVKAMMLRSECIGTRSGDDD
jgi:hypothetical protein